MGASVSLGGKRDGPHESQDVDSGYLLLEEGIWHGLRSDGREDVISELRDHRGGRLHREVCTDLSCGSGDASHAERNRACGEVDEDSLGAVAVELVVSGAGALACIPGVHPRDLADPATMLDYERTWIEV